MFQDIQLKCGINIRLRNSVRQSLSRDVLQNFIFLEITCITGHAETGYLTPQNFSPLGLEEQKACQQLHATIISCFSARFSWAGGGREVLRDEVYK